MVVAGPSAKPETKAVTGIDWQTVDGTSSGTFAYATEAENYFAVPDAVLMSETVRLTIRYRDAISEDLEVPTSKLASEGTTIALN